jgi:hypothetical protein
LLPLDFFRLWAIPIADSPSATAASTYRADRRTSMIYGLVAGLGSGSAAGLVTGAVAGPVFGLFYGLSACLMFGSFGALAAGQVLLVKLTEFTLTCEGRGRVDFLRLLQGASERQVLRQAGAVYQFRHTALQTHLAGMYQPANYR